MNPILQEVYETNLITTPDGNKVPISGQSIDRNEAALLTQLIAELKPKATLEIGLGFGVSSIAICDALYNNISSNRHIVIDPFQSHQPWNGTGMYNLRKAGFEHLVDFHDTYSYRVLPQLEAIGKRLDFAFIDGWHTFDFVLVDFFYIDKMLCQGGVVVFDDANWASVLKVIRYVVTNLPYSVYRILPSHLIQQSFKRRIYQGSLAVGSVILNNIRRIPGLAEPITRAFGAELLGVDKKYGLNSSFIALRKDGEDRRHVNHHIDF